MTSFVSLNSARESVDLETMKLFSFAFLAVCFIHVISLPFFFLITNYLSNALFIQIYSVIKLCMFRAESGWNCVPS